MYFKFTAVYIIAKMTKLEGVVAKAYLLTHPVVRSGFREENS